MTDQFVKGYALIKSKTISPSILDTYLPFVATIIVDEGMDVVDENIVCTKLQEKYSAKFQPTFIRQVLSSAMDKKLVNKVKGNYVSNISVLRKHALLDEEFACSWKSLLRDFCEYGEKLGYIANEKELEKNITAFLDAYDDHVIFNHIGDIDTTDSQFLYHWCNYILALRANNVERYSFVEGLCMANIVKATLFYSNQAPADNVDLQVFFDTPMIFALLGIDTPERKTAYQYIVDKAIAAGMSLHVYDHNIEEVLGIMERASKWSQRDDYDPAKANKVAQYFRNSDMSEEDMVEFIGEVEEKLNLMGITRYNTGYMTDENQFQADEEKITNAIKAEYGGRSSRYYTAGLYDNSIRTDVRSIVMTQRRRQGSLSTIIKTSKALFITTNSAIAKVSKDLMEEDELTKSKIPTSISADIFGTLLWMDYGDKSNNYNSFKLLADCKALLRPTPQMIAKFALSLDEAYQKRADGLTEEKFLFLRSHPIVATKLLDATSGDYAQFTDHTWRDVYAEIEAHAQFEGDKKFENERIEHEKTKDKLSQVLTDKAAEAEKSRTLQQKVDSQQDYYANTLAKVFAALIFGGPYVAISIWIILTQNQFGTFTRKGIAILLVTLLVGALATIFYNKATKFIAKIIKKKL